MTQDELEDLESDPAGEYVLGSLSRSEREAFERRLLHDFRLQDEVEAWENRLAPLLDRVEPVTPPDAVWRNLQQRLESASSRETQAGFWNSLGFWRGLSILTASLVLVLGLSLFGVIQRGAELERMMVVTNDRAQAGWVVGLEQRGNMLRVSAVAPTPLPEGRGCQLWLETEDGKLLPVGVLPHSGTKTMPLPQGVSRDGVFKVSIESLQDLPLAQPTNEFVFEGRLIRI